jgi:hypothetical protein
MGIDINLKNSKEILENKKVQLKGEDNEVKKSAQARSNNFSFNFILGCTRASPNDILILW